MAAGQNAFAVLTGREAPGGAGSRVGAHLLLAVFPSALARAAVEWHEATKEIAVSLDLQPPMTGRHGPAVGWRLITENNRELARSYLLHADEHAAKRDAQRLRAHIDGLDLGMVVTANLRGAGWCGTLDGVPVIVGARRYENRSAARGAAELARRLLTPSVLPAIAGG